ncbi:hypothetical protein AAFN85_22215 [Mucilaginibacter sp. CAU 1740]|uniref:hypothetical protein n=1 Tax=Mucilaginibacter sp. CAU 1740 TaxID=3140365 RepID=UPI00325A681F
MKPTTLLSIIFVVITSLILASCSKSFESKTYAAISAAKKRFPNLVIFDGKEYELVRCLNIPNPQVKIQLFRPTKSPDRLQQMLVISNGNNQFYSIPVPSARFKSYWNFVYDTDSDKVNKASATFETEFNKALDTLKLNIDYDGPQVLNELFVSVLQARVINKTDSTNLTISHNHKLNFSDSCQTVDQQNHKAIAKSAVEDSIKYFQRGSVFLTDQKIINYSIVKQGKKMYFKIEVYRQPCIMDIVPLFID